MIGIYKITNLKNNKVYIGQSIDIETRWRQHKRNAFNPNTHIYEYPLYRAIRKYGVENFSFTVIEETDESLLTEEEQYWIDYYDSLNPQKGYNLVPAVDAKRGENCNWAVLTDRETELIIDLLKNSSLLMQDIAAIFNVSGSCIEDINKGKRRKQEGIDYPIRKNSKSFAHRGENQNTAVLTSIQVLEIRNRYVNESLPEIYEDYKHLISFSGFKKICYGVT